MAKLHPVTKIIMVLILSIAAFIVDNLFDLFFLLLIVIVLIILTKIPLFSKRFRKIIIGLLLASFSIFIAWCFLPGSIPEEGDLILFETDLWIWPIYITDRDIFTSLLVIVRYVYMFFLMLFFFIGTSDRDLIYGLRSVKIPFAICLMINLTFRGISLFQQEYFVVKEAMMTRGVEFNHISIPRRVKNFASIMAALIILMFKRTEEMSASIESRGIPLRSKNRTVYQQFPLKKKDYTIIIGFLSFLVLIIFFEYRFSMI